MNRNGNSTRAVAAVRELPAAGETVGRAHEQREPIMPAVDRARQLYDEGMPLLAIAAATGLSLYVVRLTVHADAINARADADGRAELAAMRNREAEIRRHDREAEHRAAVMRGVEDDPLPPPLPVRKPKPKPAPTTAPASLACLYGSARRRDRVKRRQRPPRPVRRATRPKLSRREEEAKAAVRGHKRGRAA